MKRLLVGIAVLLHASVVTAEDRSRVEAMRAIRRASESCTTATLLCNHTATGELGPSDCTLQQDGTYVDFFDFSGSAGQFVTVKLTATDATFTNPVLTIFPPAGDASKTPLVIGGASQEIGYVLASTGTWSIAVNTTDTIAHGRYSLSLSCEADPSPGEPQDCVAQTALCGQSWAWAITPSSCIFGGGSTHVYSDFAMALNAGDVVNARVASGDFDPGVALYRNGGDALATGYGQRFGPDATMSYTASVAGGYDLVVFQGSNSPAIGTFGLSITCSSVCTPPQIFGSPQSVTVPTASSVSLTVSAGGVPPLSYQWYEGNTGDVSRPLGPNASTLQIVNITGTRTFWVRVSNSCGHADSSAATVTVQCSPVIITSPPQSGTVVIGSNFEFDVAATGDQPLTYQWYIGHVGDTSRPIGTNFPGVILGVLQQTTSVWERISSSCGHADSPEATVTVVPLSRKRAAKH